MVSSKSEGYQCHTTLYLSSAISQTHMCYNSKINMVFIDAFLVKFLPEKRSKQEKKNVPIRLQLAATVNVLNQSVCNHCLAW